MSNELEDRHENTQYVFTFKNLDWDAYHCYRPLYPPSMWALWVEYHRMCGNGRFDVAHDIGSGPGTAASVLGTLFRKVYVSDAGAANIATAREALGADDRFVFQQSPAEQTAAWLPAASVDFASVCMAFHYMDSERTVRAVAATLRPGATLAAVTYGFRLLFPDEPRAEALWCRACSCESLRLLRDNKLFPAAVRGLARAMTGLDFVGFPSSLFEPGVRRVYVNVRADEERPFCFVDDDAALWTPVATQVAATDTLEYVHDATWSRRVDAGWLRGFLASCQMGFGDTTWALPEWQELEAIVHARPGGMIAVEWPVSITLATRKRDT